MQRPRGGGHRGCGLGNLVTSCPSRATRTSKNRPDVNDGTDPEKPSESLSSYDRRMSGIRSEPMQSRSLEPLKGAKQDSPGNALGSI